MFEAYPQEVREYLHKTREEIKDYWLEHAKYIIPAIQTSDKELRGLLHLLYVKEAPLLEILEYTSHLKYTNGLCKLINYNSDDYTQVIYNLIGQVLETARIKEEDEFLEKTSLECSLPYSYFPDLLGDCKEAAGTKYLIEEFHLRYDTSQGFEAYKESVKKRHDFLVRLANHFYNMNLTSF